MADVDSFVGEVHGYQKQGVGFGYTKRRGYHPMLASRAEDRRGAARAAAQGISGQRDGRADTFAALHTREQYQAARQTSSISEIRDSLASPQWIQAKRSA